MILKDTFYTINSTSLEDKTLKYEVSIDPNHAIFKGHFPGNPVTPGVVQMEMIKELLSVHFQRPVKMKSMNNCKFLAILNPETSPNVLVNISLQPTDSDNIKVSVVIANETTSFLKIQAEYY